MFSNIANTNNLAFKYSKAFTRIKKINKNVTIFGIEFKSVKHAHRFTRDTRSCVFRANNLLSHFVFSS